MVPSIGKASIADYAEQEGGVAAVELLRLLHVSRQENLGPGTHPQQLMVQREATRHQASGLFHQLGIELRQEERIKTGRILHQNQQLYFAGAGVVVDIAQIFYELDYGKQHPRVA